MSNLIGEELAHEPAHDLPHRDQERCLDGVTVGIGTREAGRPRSDRDAVG